MNSSTDESTVSSQLTTPPSIIYLANHQVENMKHGTNMSENHLQFSTGSPMLVLSNTEKGMTEANVLLDSHVTPAYFKVDLQAIAHANLIAQTQEMLAQQLNQDSLTVENKKKIKKTGKIYDCTSEGCGRVFSSLNYLNLHEASHSACKTLVCDYKDCGRKFLWPAHLNYHRLTHTNDRQYMCGYEGCNKRFYTGQRLKIHSLIHTGEKPYKCDESGCGKSFTTAGNLRNHIRIHTGEKPFACDYEGCRRRFAECSSLKKHKLVHSGEKPFKCDICGKSFSQTGTRSVHVKSHHTQPSHHILKIAEITLEISTGRAVESESPDVLVLQQSSEDITHYHGLTDHVVTITTHQPENEQNPNEVPHHVLGTEEVLGGGDVNNEQLCDKNANVVVLTQPREIINLSSAYQGHEASQEEIVYDNDLLNSHLDHEEIQVTNTNLCLEQSSGEITVGESIISNQSVSVMNSQQSLSGSGETGKEIAMDPMMESDDDADMEAKTETNQQV